MPERPDLEWFVPLLREAVVGAVIVAFRVVKPPVLRVTIPGDATALLVGHSIAAVERRGPFVRFVLDPPAGAEALEVAVHPMLAGRFTVAEPGAKGNADLAAVFTLDDERELR